MKIVFMGTPDFSAAVLEKLNEQYPVCAVVTGPDKMSGRGYKLLPCALKVKAQELGIPILQYEKVSKQGIEEMKNLNPDLFVTAAFGQILSDEFLKIAPVLNVHASLLPKYRGSSPIQQAVLNGDKKTGITIMKTVKEVDAGDILLQKVVCIEKNETAGELFDRLSLLGGEAIIDAVKLVEKGTAKFVPQNNADASHCKMIKKQDGEIDFSKTYEELDCFVRGMSPWPSAFTYENEKMLKIWALEPFDCNKKGECGEVLIANNKDGLIVKVKDGAVKIAKLQPQNKKQMTSEVYLNGHKIEVGSVLGKEKNE